MLDQDCREVRELLDSYSGGELMVETNHRLMRHLRSCADCRGELAARDALREGLRRIAVPDRAPTTLGSAIRAGMAPRRASRVMLALAYSFATLALVLAWQFIREEPLTAAVLLDQAAAREQLTQRTAQVIRRVLVLEERELPRGTLIGRQRVEVWSDGRRGLLARRAYSDDRILLAGEWRRPEGRRVYRRGDSGSDSGSPEPPAESIAAGDGWRVDLSAAAIAALYPSSRGARVSRQPDAWILEFEWPASERGISRAQLFLRPDDLHAIEQRMTIHAAGALREVRWRETERAQLDVSDVAERIFVPDPELAPPTPTAPAAASAPVRRRRVSAPAKPGASLATEIGILHAIHKLDLLSSGAATVVREPSGRLALIATVPAAIEALSVVTSRYTTRELNPVIELRQMANDAPRPADAASEAVRHRIDGNSRVIEDLFARVPVHDSPISLDAAATWLTMVRDMAREIERDARLLRADLPPADPSREQFAIVRIGSMSAARVAVQRLRALSNQVIDPAGIADHVMSSTLEALERQAAEFGNPWPLDVSGDGR